MEIGSGILRQLCWPVLWTDQALAEFVGFEIFNAVADETKICCDKVCPLILSQQFEFCPPVRKGPTTKAVKNVQLSKFTIICNSLQTEIVWQVEFNCVWILLPYVSLPLKTAERENLKNSDCPFHFLYVTFVSAHGIIT